MIQKISHVLFDMDGLLINTEDIYTMAQSEILERFGMSFSWTLKAKMMGRREMEAVEILLKETNIPISPQEFLFERRTRLYQLFPQCQPLPGVLKVLKHFKQHEIPMIVATSSHKDAFLLKSRNNAELFSLFGEHILVGDDPRVKNGKPSPDIFIEAAKIIGNIDPSKCIVFEDSELGVEAGLAAGMNVIWIPDKRMEIDPNLKSKCIDVLFSMEDFQPEKYGLPPF